MPDAAGQNLRSDKIEREIKRKCCNLAIPLFAAFFILLEGRLGKSPVYSFPQFIGKDCLCMLKALPAEMKNAKRRC